MIVRDSSLYFDSEYALPSKLPGEIFVGIVRSAEYSKTLDCIQYTVEVTSSGVSYILNCRQMTKFGDAYNYEEWGLRNVKVSSPIPKPTSYSGRVGEIVVVAHLGSNPNDGVILGSLKHPARKAATKDNSLSYVSEFNGLKTTIDSKGAYKIMFNGTPLTSAALSSGAVTGTIPPPLYNKLYAGSYLTFESDGSFEVSDGHPLVQSIKLDKTNGTTTITSGNIKVVLSKKNGDLSVNAITTKISSTKSFELKTISTSIDSTKEVKIKSAKIAIGFGSIELVDSLIKIVDAIGTLIVSSPNGPCSPINTAPTWSQLEQIKVQLSTIKGSL